MPNKKNIIITIIVIRVVILLVLALVQIFLTSIFYINDGQLVSIEAGFEKLKQRVSIRSSFFILSVLFVLFDIELVLFFPGILFHKEYLFIINTIVVIVLGVVLLTLFLE